MAVYRGVYRWVYFAESLVYQGCSGAIYFAVHFALLSGAPSVRPVVGQK